MEAFSALLAICAGNSPVTGEFPAQRPVTRSFDVFCDVRLNKRLSKQWCGWCFETPSRPLWRHSDVVIRNRYKSNADLSSIISHPRYKMEIIFRPTLIFALEPIASAIFAVNSLQKHHGRSMLNSDDVVHGDENRITGPLWGNAPVTCGCPSQKAVIIFQNIYHWNSFCSLVTAYGVTKLGQHWIRQWLVSWRH